MMALHLTRKARPMAEKSPSAPLPMAASDKHQAKVEQSGSVCFFFLTPMRHLPYAHIHTKKYMQIHDESYMYSICIYIDRSTDR